MYYVIKKSWLWPPSFTDINWGGKKKSCIVNKSTKDVTNLSKYLKSMGWLNAHHTMDNVQHNLGASELQIYKYKVIQNSSTCLLQVSVVLSFLNRNMYASTRTAASGAQCGSPGSISRGAPRTCTSVILTCITNHQT